MLLGLTFERFIAVCYASQVRTINSHACAIKIVSAMPVLCLLLYTPTVFSDSIRVCRGVNNCTFYQKRDNVYLMNSSHFQVYLMFVEILFRVSPTVILLVANVIIIIKYRIICRNRITLMSNSYRRRQHSVFRKERRLVLLLVTTSVLFLVCVSPSVINNSFYNETYMASYNFQLFRACVNILELSNFALIFYVNVIFSKEFRKGFSRLFRRSRTMNMELV